MNFNDRGGMVIIIAIITVLLFNIHKNVKQLEDSLDHYFETYEKRVDTELIGK